MDVDELKKNFLARYGGTAQGLEVFFAPGRINLIGEHTDYNNGYVLPCAINFGTYLLARPNYERVVRLASENFDYAAEVTLGKPLSRQGEHWVNYPLGVYDQFAQHKVKMQGADLLYYGNIPNGAGLSSSASIEVATAVMLNDQARTDLPMMELVKLSQQAENQFVGVCCGIMDQFAVGFGKKDHALFLDIATMKYELVPLMLADYCIIVANTNKRRGLADSKYNERVKECRKAVEYLRQVRPIDFLSDMSLQEFISVKHLIPEATIRKRAAHILSENQRVLDAVAALRRGELPLLGQLMDASHNSLRYDYEVTGAELDALAEAARRTPGVLGSRMTGAGFGGCTISLVHKDAIANFIESVAQQYHQATGLQAEFYETEPGDGARKLS
ncbi:MAG: galactokinase [Bacteroidales bacterium]|nr:galactokinase [Bacteroidales bacterium]NCU36687.1 galactokinase [Candidatus Falkowbacteria bacterium]